MYDEPIIVREKAQGTWKIISTGNDQRKHNDKIIEERE